MAKYNSYTIQKIMFFKAALLSFTVGVFTEFIILQQRYLKYMTQLLLIPVMMKMRWTTDLKALALKLIGSLVKQQIG